MQARGLDWREDASNADPEYTKRNTLRGETGLMAQLAAVAGGQGALRRRLASMAEQSLILRSWLDAETTAFLETKLFSASSSSLSSSFADAGAGPSRGRPVRPVTAEATLRPRPKLRPSQGSSPSLRAAEYISSIDLPVAAFAGQSALVQQEALYRLFRAVSGCNVGSGGVRSMQALVCGTRYAHPCIAMS